MVQFRQVGAGYVRNLPPPDHRQDDLVYELSIRNRRARLALSLGMLGKEPLGQIGNQRPAGELDVA